MKYKSFYITWVVTFIVTVGLTSFIPKLYKATLAIVPIEDIQAAEGLRALELRRNTHIDRSMATEIISTENYPDLIADTHFLVTLGQQKVTDGEGNEVTVFQLFSENEVPTDPDHMTVSQAKGIVKMRKTIVCEQNKKSKLYEISCEHRDAVVVPQILRLTSRQLHAHVKALRDERAARDAAFYQTIADQMEAEIAETTVASLREAKVAAYTTILDRVFAARMVIREDNPVFIEIADPSTPIIPQSRHRAIIILLALILATIGLVAIKYPTQLRAFLATIL